MKRFLTACTALLTATGGATVAHASTPDTTPATAPAEAPSLVGAWLLTDTADPDHLIFVASFSSDGVYTQAPADPMSPLSW